jgi:AcrR family transcriptional regulator
MLMNEEVGIDRPRRRSAKGEAKRQAIVESAAELIYDRGVVAASVAELIAIAAISKSQLYNYFESKDDLVQAVVRYQAGRVLGWHGMLLAEVDDFAGLLRWRDSVVELAVEAVARGGCPLGSLASELANRSEGGARALREVFARWLDIIEAAFARIRDKGLLDPASEPRQLAVLLLSAFQGGLVLAKTARSIDLFATALDAAIAQIRLGRGYVPDPAPRSVLQH